MLPRDELWRSRFHSAVHPSTPTWFVVACQELRKVGAQLQRVHSLLLTAAYLKILGTNMASLARSLWWGGSAAPHTTVGSSGGVSAAQEGKNAKTLTLKAKPRSEPSRRAVVLRLCGTRYVGKPNLSAQNSARMFSRSINDGNRGAPARVSERLSDLQLPPLLSSTVSLVTQMTMMMVWWSW